MFYTPFNFSFSPSKYFDVLALVIFQISILFWINFRETLYFSIFKKKKNRIFNGKAAKKIFLNMSASPTPVFDNKIEFKPKMEVK